MKRVRHGAMCIVLAFSISLIGAVNAIAHDEVDPPRGQADAPVPRNGNSEAVRSPSSSSAKAVPNIEQPDPGTGCTIPPGGIYGCWWIKSYFRGSNFSIPATKYAQRTVCGFWDLSKSPSGWENKISSMANWTRDPHYYFTGKNGSGSRLTIARNSSRATLTSTFDNKIKSMSLICYAA